MSTDFMMSTLDAQVDFTVLLLKLQCTFCSDPRIRYGDEDHVMYTDFFRSLGKILTADHDNKFALLHVSQQRSLNL